MQKIENYKFKFTGRWRVFSIDESMDAIIDYRGKTPRKTDSGIPLITAKIVKNGRIETPEEFIAEDDYEDWMQRGYPQKGDIVLTTEAPLGEVAELKNDKVALAQRIITLRGKNKILNNKFLLYSLQSDYVKEQFKSRATGTTVFGIKQSELRKILLNLPPLPEQRAIAEILSSIDDKIELNNQMNRTLEAMAQAIFKQWFVDFKFPKNPLLQGEGGPLAVGEVKMIDSELGPIPEGWKVLKLDELIESVSITHKFNKDKLIFLNTSDILDGQVLHQNYTEVASFPGQAKKSIKKYDILYSEIRPKNKRFAFIDIDADDYVVSTKLMVLRVKAEIDPIVIYYHLKSDAVIEELQILAESRSGTFPQITFEQVRNLKMIIPDEVTLASYTEWLKSVHGKISQNNKESQTLSTLRDSLLPKLMSGELRVPEEIVKRYENV